jgi:hypothetical protein
MDKSNSVGIPPLTREMWEKIQSQSLISDKDYSSPEETNTINKKMHVIYDQSLFNYYIPDIYDDCLQ